MMKDEPAFPRKRYPELDQLLFHNGLTKREWFAGMAMQGMLSRASYSIENMVERSIECADALIEELGSERTI